MSRKRVSRARKRDLEQPDEFLSVTAGLIQTLNRYRTPLIIGVVVVFVARAIALILHHRRGRVEDMLGRGGGAALRRCPSRGLVGRVGSV